MATNTKDASEKGVKRYAAGTVIFREGEQGERMYVVRSGLVRLTRTIYGTEVVIDEVGPGEFCGEIALVNQQPRTATAVVARDADIITIDAPQFETMMRSNPEIALRMLKKMSERLTRAHYRISNLTLRNNKARLLHQLRNEVKQYAEAKGKSVHHPTPLPENLGDVLALEFGELKQILNQLVHDELISIDRNGYFQIVDPTAFDRYLQYLELQQRFEYRD